MCCFSPISVPTWRRWLGLGFASPRVKVSGTSIYGRLSGEEQMLAYSMKVSTPADIAMVLPLPVRPGLGEAALSFIDLASHASLFDDLRALMVPLAPAAPQSLTRGPVMFAAPKLVVHKVGSFVASFVPTQADFSRLDERFRLPAETWAALPEVADYGFAVFQLAKGKDKKIHPMAFRFVTREPGALFFPTVHIHDGRVHAEADFDHELYFQDADAPDESSFMPVGEHLVKQSKGLLAPGPLRRRRIYGEKPNRDVWIGREISARAPAK